jgi:hypothetical protein
VKYPAAFPIQRGILMAENEGLLLLRYGKDAGQEGYIPGLDFESFTQCLDNSPSWKVLNTVTEHKEVGQFTRQGCPLEVSVVKPVHAVLRNLVKIGGVSGLERSPPVQRGMAPVSETVEQQKNTSHVGFPDKEMDGVWEITGKGSLGNGYRLQLPEEHLPPPFRKSWNLFISVP